MAAAKDGYPHVVEVFAQELLSLDRSFEAQQARDAQWRDLARRLDDGLLPRARAALPRSCVRGAAGARPPVAPPRAPPRRRPAAARARGDPADADDRRGGAR